MILHYRACPGYGFTRSELLAIVAILLVVTLLIALAFPRTTHEGYNSIFRCEINLKQIYAYALAYADRSKTGRFPIAPGESPRAHESLNELIAVDREGLSPRLFVCPLSDDTPVEPDGDGRFVLSEATSSYTWTTRPLKVTAAGAPRPLASDKYVEGLEDAGGRHSGHKGGMNVLYTDGSVRFVAEKDLDPGTGLPPGLTR
jgi:prepilin-type processing-associated H-X9-DG protein